MSGASMVNGGVDSNLDENDNLAALSVRLCYSIIARFPVRPPYRTILKRDMLCHNLSRELSYVVSIDAKLTPI